MSKLAQYDQQANAFYMHLSSRKAWETLEINQHINIDLDKQGRIAGVELLNVRQFIQQIFGSAPTAEKLKSLKVEVCTETGGEVVLRMNYIHEHVLYAIPKAYTSPLVSGA